jgi:hypothetical protein
MSWATVHFQGVTGSRGHGKSEKMISKKRSHLLTVNLAKYLTFFLFIVG